eukprot:83025-Chlamydomonas_euryale.AAC.2
MAAVGARVQDHGALAPGALDDGNAGSLGRLSHRECLFVTCFMLWECMQANSSMTRLSERAGGRCALARPRSQCGCLRCGKLMCGCPRCGKLMCGCPT